MVKHAIGSYGAEVWGITDSFNGLMTQPLGVERLRLESVTDILERGGTILGTTNSGNPYAFKEGGKICDKSQLVFDGYKQLGLDAIIVIGGDGTQTIAGEFAKRGLNMVGIPKTIDNDQAATDTSVGFQTAVDVAADALGRLKSTAESHDRVMVLEIMGRDAGHIALHAGIASGSNIILIPEIPFDYAPIIKKIEERRKLGRYFSLVAVAEGAIEKGSGLKSLAESQAVFKTKHLGGIGGQVAERLAELTGSETRLTVLGHVQRGGSPCPFDRVLASQMGVHAVDLVMKNQFGVVAGIRGGQLTETSYDKLINVSAPVRLDSHLIRTAEAIGICLGRDYDFTLPVD